MKNYITILAVIFASLLLNGCTAIGDIFKAGVWVGVLGIVAVIVVIILIVRGMSKNS